MDILKDPIWAYQAPFLESKLLQTKAFSDANEYQTAFTEFKRYCLLNKLGYQDLGMHSEKVDALWHQFILFTREYQEFCVSYLGGFLHHEPSLEQSAMANSNFSRAYQNEFGQLNELWLDKANCTASRNCTAQLNCTAKLNCTAQLVLPNCTARIVG